MVGRRLAERLDPRDRPDFESRIESIRSSAGGEAASMDVLLEARNGEMRLFRTTASPLLSESAEVEGLIVSMRDFTESKRIEQQLIQSERLAAMGQMVAGAAHELNNPLTAVLGVTEMLKDSLKDETVQRHLDLVHR
jgi:signal transduction histidine kinase